MVGVSEAKTFGRGTRVLFGLQVAVAVLLSVAVALLAMEVSDWSYLRIDLSADGRNTVDEATVELIEKLDDDLVIETFFRELVWPYDRVSGDAITRMEDLLRLVATTLDSRGAVRLGDRVEVVYHDMTEAATAEQRMRELGVRGENLMVVRMGGRKAVVHLFGGICAVDWGNPTLDQIQYLNERGIPNVVDPRTWRDGKFEPATLTLFRGEEALAEAIAKVSAGTAPRAYFSAGQGERDPGGTTTSAVSALREELQRDGFACRSWNPAEDGRVPEDCELLVIAAPRDAFRPEHLAYVSTYLAGGGRVVAALGIDYPEGEGTLASFLAAHGIRPARGVVCETVTDQFGNQVEGAPQCAVLLVGAEGMAANHPITEPLRRRNRRVVLSNTPSFDVGASPQGGQLLGLLHSGPRSWRDRPRPGNGGYNHALDPSEQPPRRFTLAAVAQFRADALLPDGQVRQARLLAVASGAALSNGYFAPNRDFVMNAFNWMVERDYRVNVTPRSASAARLDVTRGSELAILTWVLWLVLPALCMAIGGAVAWRRKR